MKELIKSILIIAVIFGAIYFFAYVPKMFEWDKEVECECPDEIAYEKILTDTIYKPDSVYIIHTNIYTQRLTKDKLDKIIKRRDSLNILRKAK